MGRHTLEGNPPIDVTLRKSARARRLSLRVSRLDGRVTLTLPQYAPRREAIAFLESREGWLRRHLDGLTPVQAVAVGRTVPLYGADVPIVTGAGRAAVFRAGRITVPSGKPVGVQVKALMRHLARDALVAASDHYAAMIGRHYTRLTLRDTRSRWGSCTRERALMYSWRLVMAPPEVLSYVAAHEVAHLVEMNHQPAFWDVVERLCPDYAVHRQWLRDHGDRLHRISFDD